MYQCLHMFECTCVLTPTARGIYADRWLYLYFLLTRFRSLPVGYRYFGYLNRCRCNLLQTSDEVA